MPRQKIDPAELKRAVARLPEYPAVLTPGVGGSFEVVFPNFAKLTAFGVGRDPALAAAREMLSAHLQGLLEEGQEPPRPSDPARLVADEDEPAGTELVSIVPDRGTILRRLGLGRDDRGLALASLGRLGR